MIVRRVSQGRSKRQSYCRSGAENRVSSVWTLCLDRETWDRVEALLAEHAQRTAGSRQNSDALLSGKLFDNRGNRMSATHASKRGAGDGATMSRRRSCRVTNTRPDPLRASRRWRLSEGSPKRRAPPCPSTIISVQLDGNAVQEEQSAPVRDPIFRRNLTIDHDANLHVARRCWPWSDGALSE